MLVSNAQEHESVALEFSVGPHFSFHTGNFMWSPEAEMPCGPYTSGNGVGISIRAYAEFPSLFGFTSLHPLFGVELRGKPGEFTNTEVVPASGGGTNPPVPHTIVHTFAPSMSEVVASIGFDVPLVDNALGGPLSLRPHVAFGSILTGDWRQDVVNEITGESITEVGNLDNTLSQYFLGMAVQHEVEINSSLSLTQNLQYQYALGNVANSSDWQAHSLTFSVGLRGLLSSESTAIPMHNTIPQHEPVPRDTQQFAFEVVEDVSVDSLTQQQIVPEQLRIVPTTGYDTAWIEEGSELTALYSLAIVNAVFFDSASAEVPSAYVTQPRSRNNVVSPLDAHAFVLVDLFATLENNPNARCVLTGATSGVDQEPMFLAQARAERVKTLLVGMGIQPSRIVVKARELPMYPSNGEFPEGRAENRRVDIELLDAPSVRYVSSRTFRTLFVRQTYAFTASSPSQAEHATVRIGSWSDVVSAATKGVLDREIRLQQEQTINIHAEITVNDTITESTTASVDLNSLTAVLVEQDLRHFRPLLRFNYNSSELTAENKELLRQIVKAIPEEVDIVIRGTSDQLGSALRNEQLRNERATNVASFLKTLLPKTVDVRTEVGPGSFSSETPAGRFLNRAIQILVLPR